MTIWLMQHLILTALLAFGVAVLCKLTRIRPAVSHMLWLLVLIKLLTPPIVTWPWTPAELIEGLGYKHEARTVGSSNADSVVTQTTLPFLRLIGAAPANPASTVPSSPSLTTRYRQTGLLGVWAFGIVFMAGLQVFRIIRFRRLTHACTPVPEWLNPCAQALAHHFRVKTPKLLASSQVGSAITWSVGHPRIIVPETLLETVKSDGWRVILAHELAHLKRRNHWTGWVELLAGCVWWWNPVFWYARKRLHESAEMACDAWVVWALPEQRREYAEALVRVVELASQTHAVAPALGMGGGPAVAFERRLVMILRQHVPCRIPVIASILLVLFAAAILPSCTTPATKRAVAAPEPAPVTTDIEKVLDSPVGIEFENIHVSEIIEFISDSWDVNIVIDSRAVARPPKTKPAAPAPEQSPQPKPETPAPEASPQPTEAPPKPGPDCVTNGIVPFIKLNDIPMREALNTLLRPLNLTFTVEPNHVWISSPALIEADARHPKPSLSTASENLVRILQSPVGIEFENIHLQEALEFVSDSWQVNIMLDSRVVRPPKPHHSEPPLGSPGYVTDGVVPYINLMNVPMAEALHTMIRPLNLTFKADKDVIWISSYDLIDAPPLTAERVSKPSGVHAPVIKVMRILEAKDGCLVWIDCDGHLAWYKEGDVCDPYTVVKVDPKELNITFHRDEKNESMSMKPTNGVVKEPEASGPVNERVAPNVRALRVRTVDGRLRVQIQSAAGNTWYDEGHRFEDYEVVRINPDAKTVLMYSDSKKTPFMLNVKEKE